MAKAPWEEDYSSQESVAPWDEYKNSAASKPKESPITTFASKAINALGFGFPEYMEKKFQPERYAQSQQSMAGNPLAANTGEIAGDIAGLIIPGFGAVKGAQIGGRVLPKVASGVEGLIGKVGLGSAERFPTLGPIASEATRYLTQKAGMGIGGILGAQTGAALPGIVQGDPAKAASRAEMVNNIPYVPTIPGPAQHAVPALAAGAAGYVQSGMNALKDTFTPQQQSAPQQSSVLQQPPTAGNYLERMIEISKRFRL
jgi:hypothetical protein